MIHQFTFNNILVTVEDMLTAQGEADMSANPHIRFQEPGKESSTVYIESGQLSFEGQFNQKQIVTQNYLQFVDNADGQRLQVINRPKQPEGAQYFQQFFNMRTGSLTFGQLAVRAMLNNAMERNLIRYFNDSIFCFAPQVGYQFFEPIEVRPKVVNNGYTYTVFLKVKNLSGNEFSYKTEAGEFQESGIFEGVEPGEHTFYVKDLTQTAMRKFAVVRTIKLNLVSELI
jgi:hypothetical protein